MISPTALFHPPPAPHFKTFQVNEDKTKYYMQIKITGTKDITRLNTDNFAFENVTFFLIIWTPF
jgi:hypothetical protein